MATAATRRGARSPTILRALLRAHTTWESTIYLEEEEEEQQQQQQQQQTHVLLLLL
jgi:hypothetical protein